MSLDVTSQVRLWYQSRRTPSKSSPLSPASQLLRLPSWTSTDASKGPSGRTATPGRHSRSGNAVLRRAKCQSTRKVREAAGKATGRYFTFGVTTITKTSSHSSLSSNRILLALRVGAVSHQFCRPVSRTRFTSRVRTQPTRPVIAS